ncbi:hypothetical protein VFPPC_11925 [Pochonia chlamydosporia 170]|uniref:Uncharacterized protein n=1 Tax=Pochonia chlamydosporia 170 TaxID=1380566 RepID=A0A179FVF5_METCM|nr:hypothetical protein VFPPC_11925 [Pochonia chlamydosporia 170]OAQ69594.1 hypothetical protein VFPPC_11925 [Pochonia chlamydosporia 170]
MTDSERLYPLIKHFVCDSSSADAVGEVALARFGPLMKDPKFRRPNQTETNPIDDGHLAVEEYIKHICLPNDTTDTMLKSWAWEANRRMGNMTPQIQLRDPARNYFNTTAILLLSLCKNISTLYIGTIFYDLLGQYLRMVNYGETPVPALQKLQHVHIGALMAAHEPPEDFYSFYLGATLRLFHRLPSMTTISMDGVCDNMEPEFYIERVANMKKMYITRSDIRTFPLDQMIRFPKALEEFTLTTGGLFSRHGSKPCIISRTLGKALRQHRHTLKTLNLSSEDLAWPAPWGVDDDGLSGKIQGESYEALREFYGPNYIQKDLEIQDPQPKEDDDPPDQPLNGIGSLHDFPQLTYLSLSLQMLFGFGCELYDGASHEMQVGPKPQKSLV